jgi:hypothetical protein
MRLRLPVVFVLLLAAVLLALSTVGWKWSGSKGGSQVHRIAGWTWDARTFN